MFEINKKSIIKKVMNTDYSLEYDNDLLCFYINSGLAKSIYIDEDGDFRIKFDYNYILNTDLNTKITDALSYKAISRLRYALATLDDFISEPDRIYLKSVGYDHFYDDVVAGVWPSIEYNLFDFWQLLLSTGKQLRKIGVPSSKVSNINKKIMRRGFSLRPENNIKNLNIHSDNVEELSSSDIKLEREQLLNRKQELRKELSRVLIRIEQIDRMNK